MATNKRKDAAALFELIDKSTLKIPKHSGSLKIPSWWSSKTNPPAASSSSVTAVSPAAGSSSRQPDASAGTLESPPPSPAAPQRRLFEPSIHHGSVSPSIRPPAPASVFRMARPAPANPEAASRSSQAAETSAAAPVTRAPAPPGTTAPLGTPAAETSAVVAEPVEGYAGSGNGRRIFAPQTMSQGEGLRSEWVSPRFHLARAPLWILVTGGAVAAVIVVLVFYGLVHAFSGSASGGVPAKPQANAALPNTPSIPSAQHPLLPRTTAADHPQPSNTPAPVPPAQVYAPGTAARSPRLYYIQISSVRDPHIAQENAKLLADHGVNVSIEAQQGKTALWYKLFSVEGFASLSESEALRSHIVAIGRLHKDFARTRKGAFDDAFAARWSAITGVKE